MSVTQVPLQPVKKGTLTKLWLAIAALIALAYGIAYMGAGQFKSVSIETVTAGKGPFVGELDGVFIEYTGTTENGTVFDSTKGRGAAPFLVMQLFPGFKQALAQMQKGGRYKIVVPGRLAYGKSPPAGSPIGPNEDLAFEVYVADVVPNAALSAGAAQQPPQQ